MQTELKYPYRLKKNMIQAPSSLSSCSLKEEPLKMSCDYSVTLTLSPLLLARDTLKQAECASICFHYCLNLLRCKYKCSATLEETKDYNIHIHAIISLELTERVKYNGVRFVLMEIFRNKNWGRIKEIDQVLAYNYWTKYIMKDFLLPDYNRLYYPLLLDGYGLSENHVPEEYYLNNPSKRRPSRN